ncbi:MAG: hypothetical protein M1822_008769 [Bathelium mastoideum]|nr:MAG: hypothetical protein M1822_008769 [Bathelium mastoideum]
MEDNGDVPVPGSDELPEGKGVNEGTEGIGSVPVPGSDELPEGEGVNEGIMGAGVVPATGNVELDGPGYGNRDEGPVIVGAVPVLKSGEVGAGYDVRFNDPPVGPPVAEMVTLLVAVVEYVPDRAPEKDGKDRVPVLGAVVLRVE